MGSQSEAEWGVRLVEHSIGGYILASKLTQQRFLTTSVPFFPKYSTHYTDCFRHTILWLLSTFTSSLSPPPPCCPLLVVSSYSCVSSLGESSLIGGASADRLTNSLFINGLSVPGSQRSQRRTIQFSSIDFMSPCRPIFITGIKTLIKDKK